MPLSARERQRQSIIQDRRRIRLERQTERILGKEFRRMSKQVTEDYINGGEARAQVGLEVHQRNIAVILLDAYRKSSISSAQYLNDYFGKCFRGKIEKKDMFSFWDNPDMGNSQATTEFLALFRTEAYVESKYIADTTRESLVRVTEAVVLEGAGEVEVAKVIAKNIGSEMLSKNMYRVRTIARTEVGTALMKSQYEIIGGMELPPMVKVWSAVMDSRTRKDHREVDRRGDRLRREQTFNVGGKQMKYPQDRNGGKENIINCRCVLIWEPAEDN